MFYNLIPAGLQNLPLSLPTLTLIAVSALFTVYLLTVMPRQKNFEVNGRVMESIKASLPAPLY